MEHWTVSLWSRSEGDGGRTWRGWTCYSWTGIESLLLLIRWALVLWSSQKQVPCIMSCTLNNIKHCFVCSSISSCLQVGVVLVRWAWLWPLHRATARAPVRSPGTRRAGSPSSTSKMAPGSLGTTLPGGKIWSSGWESTQASWQTLEHLSLYVDYFFLVYDCLCS